jgi:hypothetical protein
MVHVRCEAADTDAGGAIGGNRIVPARMVDHPICCVRWPTKAAIAAMSKLSLLVSCAGLFFFLGPVVPGWFPSLVRIIGVHGLKGLEGI